MLYWKWGELQRNGNRRWVSAMGPSLSNQEGSLPCWFEECFAAWTGQTQLLQVRKASLFPGWLLLPQPQKCLKCWYMFKKQQNTRTESWLKVFGMWHSEVLEFSPPKLIVLQNSQYATVIVSYQLFSLAILQQNTFGLFRTVRILRYYHVFKLFLWKEHFLYLLETQMEGTGPGVTPKRDSPFKKHPAT